MSDTKNHKDSKKEPPALDEAKAVTITQEEYLKLKQEADMAKESHDRLLRVQADFENSRKRLEKERLEFVKFANEGIILGLLNILDDLERAVSLAQTKHEDPAAFLKGMEMILAHLYDMLKGHGVRPIEAQGKKFDPNYHEALMQVENKELADHTIVEELQKGYLLNDRVVRTAKVKVSVQGCIDTKTQ